MLLGTVVVFCVFSVFLPLSTHGRVGEEAQTDDQKYKEPLKITIDAKVLNQNGPNIFVHIGDAAHSSSKRQVIDYRYEAGPEKIN